MLAMEGCGLTRTAGHLSMLVGIFVHVGHYISYIAHGFTLYDMMKYYIMLCCIVLSYKEQCCCCICVAPNIPTWLPFGMLSPP